MPIAMSEMQKSALLEVGNIGSGHAAIALSQLMGRKIMIAIPSIEVIELTKLYEILNGKDKNFVQVTLKVLGDAKGALVFTMREDMAFSLCDIVMGLAKGETRFLGEIEQSALKEVGSIISASYLNAISEMTSFSLIVSTPEYQIGKMKQLNDILSRKDMAVNSAGKALCIRTEFIEAATRIDGYLVFIPAENAIEKIIGALGV